MLNRVAEFISRYNMFTPNQSVGVAVSGGADSVCLLHVLKELAPRWNLRLSVIHLNHRLRGEESSRDARFVQELAVRHGLPVYTREVDVRELQSSTGDNLEQAAREARRLFFRECISNGLADRVATGHTRSDQAETILLRLLRGTGPGGLTGVLPVTLEGLVRPLLGVDREEVETYLKERDIGWLEDSSNLDPSFSRNRIRHQLLPALRRGWNPALSQILAQTATLAQDEEMYWEGEIQRLADLYFLRQGAAVVVSARMLLSLELPVARRLLRHAVRAVRGNLRRIEFQHIEAILELAAETEGHGRIQLPGLDVLRSFELLRLAPLEQAYQGFRRYRLPLPVPGSAAIPGSGARIAVAVSTRRETQGGLDWEKVPGPLELRSWIPGDQYRPAGYTRPARIKLMFQEHKVPLWERGGWPLVVCGDAIVWARRFGPAVEYASSSTTQRVLEVLEIE